MEIYKFNNILSSFLFLSYFPYGFQYFIPICVNFKFHVHVGY
jgi:hypothetical protein